jgi:NAD(P)-dependent dehydrogenase (short-subunit alcohol dehydrogenase family)
VSGDRTSGCRRFGGRTALVTGAGAGIGKATALRLAAEGAALMLTDRDAAGIGELAAELASAGHAVHHCLADVSLEEDWIRVIAEVRQRFGRLDVLVNNAGGGNQVRPVTDYEVAEWRELHDTDLLGTMLGMKHAIPLLRSSSRSSAVVNLASSMGLMGFPGIPSYSAAKGGVIALSRQVAYDFAKDGVRVNCVCPGPTKTERLQGLVAKGLLDEAHLIGNVLLGRWATPAEIAAAIVFLASDDASFVTATALVVDGGQTSH